jgi:phosphinothricin acetyltransferase
MKSLLANVSSRNEASLNFHLKNGFVECGRFKDVGTKFGEYFDVVWLQKFLEKISKKRT